MTTVFVRPACFPPALIGGLEAWSIDPTLGESAKGARGNKIHWGEAFFGNFTESPKGNDSRPLDPGFGVQKCSCWGPRLVVEGIVLGGLFIWSCLSVVFAIAYLYL